MYIDIVYREGGMYVVYEEYRDYWVKLVNGLGEEEELFLRSYVYWWCSSIYSGSDVVERRGILYRNVYSGMGEEGYNRLLGVVWVYLERLLDEVGSQEERVYRKLVERIDRVLGEYSRSEVGDLSEEPKRVKALLDLMKLKAQMVKELGLGGSNRKRGSMEESLVEKLL